MKPALVACRATAAVPFLLIVYAIVRNSALPWPAALAFIILLVASTLWPAVCLQILTATVPFAVAWGGHWSRTLRLSEALIVTFLGGALLHLALWTSSNSRGARPLELSAKALSALAIASWIVELFVLQYATDYPLHFLASVWTLFTRDFFVDPGLFTRLKEATLLVEGVAILICTRRLAARSPSLPAALVRLTVVAATAAATLNLVRYVEVVIVRGAASYLEVAQTLRFSVSHGDVNAAGSYFAMALPIAVGFSIGGWRKAGWAVAGALIAAALWFSGSRVGMAGAGIAVVTLLVASFILLRNRPAVRIAVGILLIATLATIGTVAVYYPAGRNISLGASFDVRADMARVAIRLFETRPFFGVGIGTFWTRSSEYIPPLLKKTYSHENAHNNYLQILAELGITGASAFLAVLVLALRPLRPVRGPHAVATAGALCGILAFLLSCFGGHPLLTPEVCYPFWILIAAISVTRDDREVPFASESQTHRGAMTQRWIVLSIVAVLAVSIPFRVHREIKDRSFEDAAVGYSLWNTSEDSVRFRWAQPHSWFFVPRSVAWVLVPVRLGDGGPTGVTVEIRLDGRPANRVKVMRDAWTIVRIVVPQDRRTARYLRIELEIDDRRELSAGSAAPDARTRLMVGRITVS